MMMTFGFCLTSLFSGQYSRLARVPWWAPKSNLLGDRWFVYRLGCPSRRSPNQ